MDSTNAGIPSNNPQLSGDATKVAAIARLKKLQEAGVGKVKNAYGGPPGGSYGAPPKAS